MPVTYCTACGLGTSYSIRKPDKCSNCNQTFASYVEPKPNTNNDMTNMLVKNNPPNDYVMSLCETTQPGRNPNQVYDYDKPSVKAPNPITEDHELRNSVRNPNETLASLGLDPNDSLKDLIVEEETPINMGMVLNSAANAAKIDISKVKKVSRNKRK